MKGRMFLKSVIIALTLVMALSAVYMLGQRSVTKKIVNTKTTEYVVNEELMTAEEYLIKFGLEDEYEIPEDRAKCPKEYWDEYFYNSQTNEW